MKRSAALSDKDLSGFSGILQVDGYSAYTSMIKARAGTGSNETIQLAGCRVGGVVTEPRPSQIRTCRFPASGSSRSSFAQIRLH